MQGFGYLAPVLYRKDGYITAIWKALVPASEADIGQIHITVQPDSTVKLYWDEGLILTCVDDCVSAEITLTAGDIHSITVKYEHTPSANDPGYSLTWTGNSAMLSNCYSCVYPVSQDTHVFLLSQLSPSLTNSALAYFDSSTNQYTTSNIQLTAGKSHLFVLLLKDEISNIRFDYSTASFTWTSSIANQSGNSVFDSLSGTHHIHYQPKVAGTGALIVESTLSLPITVTPGEGNHHAVSPAQSRVDGPSTCQVGKNCSYTVNLKDEWGNSVRGVDGSLVYAAVLFKGVRRGLTVNMVQGVPEIVVSSGSTGEYRLEVLWKNTAIASSGAVLYSFTS